MHADAMQGGQTVRIPKTRFGTVRLERSLLAVADRLGVAEINPGGVPLRGGVRAHDSASILDRRPGRLGLFCSVGADSRHVCAVRRAAGTSSEVGRRQRRGGVFREVGLEVVAGEGTQTPVLGVSTQKQKNVLCI